MTKNMEKLQNTMLHLAFDDASAAYFLDDELLRIDEDQSYFDAYSLICVFLEKRLIESDFNCEKYGELLNFLDPKATGERRDFNWNSTFFTGTDKLIKLLEKYEFTDWSSANKPVCLGLFSEIGITVTGA